MIHYRSFALLATILIFPRLLSAESLLDSGYIPGVGKVPYALTKAGVEELAGGDTKTDATATGDQMIATGDSTNTGTESATDTAQPAKLQLSISGPQPVPHGKVYSRSENAGVVIAGQDSWYLEEFDSLERPAMGTTWTSGEISRQVSWLYYDETQLVRTRVDTAITGSTVTDYDRSGHVLSVVTGDADGNELTSVRNTYGEDGSITESIETAGKTVKRTTYIYDKNAFLIEKRGYTNGVLNIVTRWKDEDNWTETVYSKGRVVLVATYVDGVRQKETNAKKR